MRQILSTLCHAAERANPADDPAPDEGGDQWTVARQLASHHQCRARLWSLRAGDNPRLWLWLDVQSWVTISMPLGWQGKVGRIRHCRDSRCPCTITIQHCAPKGKPVDPSRPWDWTPSDPTIVSDDPYWTRSMTAEEVQLGSYGNNKRRLWQVTMTLPPNSMYVMSGPSRYDWQHGVNCDPNHPVPKSTSSYISAGGRAVQVPAEEWLFPSWNKFKARRGVIYRSTKCFSDLCLQQEREKAYTDRDFGAVTAVNARIDASHRFKPQDQHASRELTEDEIEAQEKMGCALIKELKRSGVHRLRFAKSEVLFESDNMTRAAGDIDAPAASIKFDEDGNVEEDEDEKKEDDTTSIENIVAFSGQGRRLGQSWEDQATAKEATLKRLHANQK